MVTMNAACSSTRPPPSAHWRQYGRRARGCRSAACVCLLPSGRPSVRPFGFLVFRFVLLIFFVHTRPPSGPARVRGPCEQLPSWFCTKIKTKTVVGKPTTRTFLRPSPVANPQDPSPARPSPHRQVPSARRRHVVRDQRAPERADDRAVRRTVPGRAAAVGQGARVVQQADGTSARVPAHRGWHGRRGAGRARGGQQDQEHPVHVPAGAEEDQGNGAAASGPVRRGGGCVAVRAQATVVPDTGLDDRRCSRQTAVLVSPGLRHVDYVEEDRTAVNYSHVEYNHYANNDYNDSPLPRKRTSSCDDYPVSKRRYSYEQQQSSTELFAKYIATSVESLPPRLAIQAQKELHDVLFKYKLMECDQDQR